MPENILIPKGGGGGGSGTVTSVASGDTSIVVTNPTTTPSLQLASLSTIAANEGGTVPIANGGTGSTTAAAALTALGAGIANTVQSAYLTGDVTMTNANTFYDGPALTLVAGTWLLLAVVQIVNNGATVDNYTGKIWDGTTPYGAAYTSLSAATNTDGDIVIAAVAVLASGATLKASVASTSGGDTLKATPRGNNTGLTNLGSGIFALRVA